MSRPEIIAGAICRSRAFETGQGTCAPICMDQLGDPRKKGCPHASNIHAKLAIRIATALEAAEEAAADA